MERLRVKRRERVVEIECRWNRGLIDETSAQALCEVAEDLRTDPDSSVVLLRSLGRDFCLGFDGSKWGAMLDCVAAVAALPQAVVVEIQGRAWAEGCELALAGDLRIADADASFRLPQIGEGRMPSHGGTQRLPRLVGVTRALEILWSGRRVGAAEAVRIGLAARSARKNRLGAEVNKIVAELRNKGPIAVRLAKEAVLAALDLSLDEGIRLEQDLYVLLQTTRDRAEGVRAFLEKRRPRFVGR